MFALTKKTDYAIIALAHMARRPGRLCNAREIAARFGVPPALLMNILKVMTQHELIRSIRGAKGGYTLSLPAEKITLESIITAVEGPVRFVQCSVSPGLGESPCELLSTCPVSRPVKKVHAKLREFLHRVTLAEIAHDPDYGGSAAELGIEGVPMTSRKESVR